MTALLHHMSIDVLRGGFVSLKKRAAAGVDAVTWDTYAETLEENLQDLHRRVHSGAYRALPSRRVFIPKADGKQRPLGIASIEDKIVQAALVMILTPIYEAQFLGFSYGFRPGRSQHDALDALAFGIKGRYIWWVLDADIRRFFDTISHEWMVKFLEHRIGDRRVIRLIQKWLTAGVLEQGMPLDAIEGTPQGAVITPLTQKVTLPPRLVLRPTRRWRPTILRGSGRDGDAMADSDGVVTDQNLLHHEPHNSLPLNDIERVGSAAQTGKERRESLCQAQESSAIVGLVSDSLQLGP